LRCADLLLLAYNGCFDHINLHIDYIGAGLNVNED
jgi:hypothetical protein